MKVQVLISFLASAIAFNMMPGKVNGQNITTIAGCGIGNDSLSTNAEVILPMKAVFDNAGNTYIVDGGNNMIRKVDASGVITTFAGTGDYGSTGDGGPATAATFGDIYSLAIDKFGNLLVVDAGYSTLREVNTSGIISTVAGTGSAGYSGDGLAATLAQLNQPSDVATDTAGNIYIDDRFNYRVRKINTSGIITTVAGDGGIASPVFGGPATATSLGYPFRIAVDKNGNLFVASYANWHIMKIDVAGILTNIAGTGSYGYSGDGGPATAATFSAPCGLALDSTDNVYFSDINAGRIRRVDAVTGIITTAVGTGLSGYTGDGGPATAAEISDPEGLAFDADNNLYIADLANNRVRMVNPSGIISTFAGQNGLFGEGYPAVNAELTFPLNLTTDAAGNVYLADIYNHRVRMINASTGKITTVAGAGISGYEDAFSGDGGAATLAHIYYPSAVAVDAAGNLYICDQDNQRIRKVSSSGIISTIAGNGTVGYAGNGTSALTAEFHYPTGIAVDAAGNVYVCDNNNHRVRKINTSGTITTLAGNGVAGYNGDGIPATMAQLNYPADVAVDAMGNVYLSDQGNNRIRVIDTTGVINTIAGDGTPGNSGDGGPAIAAQLWIPQGIKIDNAGNIFIADNGNNTIRMVSAAGIITTLAGSGSRGFSGDGGPAISATLNNPSGVAVDLMGNVYIADGGNNRVRKVNISSLSVTVTKAGLSGVLVYPNPTKGTINIINAANSEVVVNDVTGREVMRASLTNAKETVDVNSFAAGVYLLQV